MKLILLYFYQMIRKSHLGKKQFWFTPGYACDDQESGTGAC